MSDTETVTAKSREPERTDGRKRKERPQTRVSLEDYQSKLDVIEGKDPAFYYRWVKDSSEYGTRIYELRSRGFEFALAKDHKVAIVNKFDTAEDGSIIRKADGKGGGYMYFMRQPMEYRNEDQAYKQRLADEQIQSVYTPESLQEDMGGVHGSINIERSS